MCQGALVLKVKLTEIFSVHGCIRHDKTKDASLLSFLSKLLFCALRSSFERIGQNFAVNLLTIRLFKIRANFLKTEKSVLDLTVVTGDFIIYKATTLRIKKCTIKTKLISVAPDKLMNLVTYEINPLICAKIIIY